MSTAQPNVSASAGTECWTELVIALHRDQTYNNELGALFPPGIDVSSVHTVLDIGCGPGGWILSAIKKYPHMKGTGIDISTVMIGHARLLAQAEGVQQQAEFQVMDATHTLDFADGSFDFIQIRTLCGFLYREQWPVLIEECSRLLRSGGHLCITEIEVVVPGSEAADTINLQFGKLLYAAGFSFAPTGRTLGLTARLRPMLEQSHFTSITQQAHAIDVSRHSHAWQGAFEEFISLQQTTFPLIVAFQMLTQEALDSLYQQALEDMQSDSYGCMIYFLSVCGKRPEVGGQIHGQDNVRPEKEQ